MWAQRPEWAADERLKPAPPSVTLSKKLYFILVINFEIISCSSVFVVTPTSHCLVTYLNTPQRFFASSAAFPSKWYSHHYDSESSRSNVINCTYRAVLARAWHYHRGVASQGAIKYLSLTRGNTIVVASANSMWKSLCSHTAPFLMYHCFTE